MAHIKSLWHEKGSANMAFAGCGIANKKKNKVGTKFAL